LLLVENIADKINEELSGINPFTIRLDEKNIVEISKKLFPFFREHYLVDYYPTITGKNKFLVEEIGFHSIYNFLFIKEFKIDDRKYLKYLKYFINVEFLILNFKYLLKEPMWKTKITQFKICIKLQINF
jgi:hypothetical protein